MSLSCNHTSIVLPISFLYLLTPSLPIPSDPILAQNGAQLRTHTMYSIDCMRNSDAIITCKCKQDGQQNTYQSILSTICHCSQLNCQKLVQHCTWNTQFANVTLLIASIHNVLICNAVSVHVCLTKDPYAQVNIHASLWLQRLHKYLVQRTCAHSSVEQCQSPCRNVAAVIAPSKNAWRRSCLPQRTPRTSVTLTAAQLCFCRTASKGSCMGCGSVSRKATWTLVLLGASSNIRSVLLRPALLSLALHACMSC